jgi:hypothetical protein
MKQKLALFHERNTQGNNRRVASQTSRLLPNDFPEDFMMELQCECTQQECDKLIAISCADYRVRMGHDGTFVIRPEHFAPTLEVLIDRSGEYWVVMKR